MIARDVSIGQTVAASLQTPTLYSIAQDLTKMELDLAVGEPDIGRVQAGDPVSFSVLAYPNRTFSGTVQQVRKNPTVVSNVVTYDTVVIVNNQDGALMPGMTANATIQVAHVDNAVIVPLAAFSYTPPTGALKGGHRRPASGTAQNGAERAVRHEGDGGAVRHDELRDARRRERQRIAVGPDAHREQRCGHAGQHRPDLRRPKRQAASGRGEDRSRRRHDGFGHAAARHARAPATRS